MNDSHIAITNDCLDLRHVKLPIRQQVLAAKVHVQLSRFLQQ